jgi:hypothetical protein
MSKDPVTKTKDVRAAVDAELGFDPLVDSADITVRNIAGDVTLTGTWTTRACRRSDRSARAYSANTRAWSGDLRRTPGIAKPAIVSPPWPAVSGGMLPARARTAGAGARAWFRGRPDRPRGCCAALMAVCRQRVPGANVR